MSMTVLYHLASDADWQAAQSAGSYSAPSLASEGFIHCATAEQLRGVHQRYYQQARAIWLLTLEMPPEAPELVWENTSGGQDLFPHWYGELPQALIKQAEVLIDQEAQTHWPAGF